VFRRSVNGRRVLELCDEPAWLESLDLQGERQFPLIAVFPLAVESR